MGKEDPLLTELKKLRQRRGLVPGRASDAQAWRNLLGVEGDELELRIRAAIQEMGRSREVLALRAAFGLEFRDKSTLLDRRVAFSESHETKPSTETVQEWEDKALEELKARLLSTPSLQSSRFRPSRDSVLQSQHYNLQLDRNHRVIGFVCTEFWKPTADAVDTQRVITGLKRPDRESSGRDLFVWKSDRHLPLSLTFELRGLGVTVERMEVREYQSLGHLSLDMGMTRVVATETLPLQASFRPAEGAVYGVTWA